jgi:hypothetical protein
MKRYTNLQGRNRFSQAELLAFQGNQAAHARFLRGRLEVST